MLSKGIIEELLTPTLVRVRIPIIHKLKNVPNGTPTSELGTAIICTLPNCTPNLKVDDVVIVGFEDNDYGKPIIFGVLFTGEPDGTLSDLKLGSLEVVTETVLSTNTTIGKIKYEELSKLSGLTDNVQSQINLINEKIDKICTLLGIEIEKENS